MFSLTGFILYYLEESRRGIYRSVPLYEGFRFKRLCQVNVLVGVLVYYFNIPGFLEPLRKVSFLRARLALKRKTENQNKGRTFP